MMIKMISISFNWNIQEKHYKSKHKVYNKCTLFLINYLFRVQHGINVCIVIWFLFGNYLVFFNSDTTTCDLTAKAIYDLSYAIVLYGYILVTLPIFYSVVTFLLMPCFIRKFLFFFVTDLYIKYVKLKNL